MNDAIELADRLDRLPGRDSAAARDSWARVSAATMNVYAGPLQTSSSMQGVRKDPARPVDPGDYLQTSRVHPTAQMNGGSESKPDIRRYKC
jgi:hypothetical protein